MQVEALPENGAFLSEGFGLYPVPFLGRTHEANGDPGGCELSTRVRHQEEWREEQMRFHCCVKFASERLIR